MWPPTLISFAIAPIRAGEVLSAEFKTAGHPVYRFGVACPDDASARKDAWTQFHALCAQGKVAAAWAVEHSAAEAVMQMSFGNRIGLPLTLTVTPPGGTPCPGIDHSPS